MIKVVSAWPLLHGRRGGQVTAKTKSTTRINYAINTTWISGENYKMITR